MENAQNKFTREMVEQKFDPRTIQSNLLKASAFITIYELLKGSIVDDVRSFIVIDAGSRKALTSAKYKSEVLDQASHVFEASCLWLAKMGAIQADDVKSLQGIRDYRNQLAHDLPKLILNPSLSFDSEMLSKAVSYVDQIGRFWVRIDASINPDFDDIDVYAIPDSEVMSGRMMVARLLVDAISAHSSAPGGLPT